MKGFLLAATILLSACDQASVQSLLAVEDYAQARKLFWQELYPQSAESLYCGETVNSARRDGYNIEHVFPMSWVGNALACGTRQQCRAASRKFNLIEADLHNLYPARTDVNHARGSLRFDYVSGEQRKFGQQCDFETNTRQRAAEPRPAVRGEIARIMFYMAWRYQADGLEIFARSGKILQKWHNEDPPDAHERRRNDQIARIQGVRNPFIDEPSRLNDLIAEGFFYRD